MTAPSYREAYIAVGFLSFGHIFYTLGNVMGYGITIQKNGKMYLLVNASGAICNIALNFFLVPKMGYVGAAITTCTAQLISMLVSRHFAEKMFRCNYRYIRSLILTIGFLALSYGMGELQLWFKIPAFLLGIGVVLLFYKDRLPYIKKLVKRK